MSGRKGDVASSTGKSNKDSITKAENLPVVSHRESRRRLFKKAQEEEEDFEVCLISNLAYLRSPSGKARETEVEGVKVESPESVSPRYRPESGRPRHRPESGRPRHRPEFGRPRHGPEFGRPRHGLEFGREASMDEEAHHKDPIHPFLDEEAHHKDPIHPFFRIPHDILQIEKDGSEPLKLKEEDSFCFEAPSKTGVGKDYFVVLKGKVWKSKAPKSRDEVHPKRMELKKEGHMMMEEEHETQEEPDGDQQHCWVPVSQFRSYWNQRWSGYYGSYEDTTKIPSMRFTFKPVDIGAVHRDTLQIFSVKLAATRGGLKLPLDVFGMVAVRDPVDHNRNIIFHRQRDDCQTLTEKDPYLVLSGPTRAVILEIIVPVIIEVDLKVKGTIESKDVDLSFLVAPVKSFNTLYSHLFNYAYTSKLSTLEFTLGEIYFSVEATISLRIVHGSWPDGLRGLFAAYTTGFTDRCPTRVRDKTSTGTGAERIILLDSGGEKLPVAGDGEIKISRRVVSVEGCGELIVQVNAFKGELEIVEKRISFHASEDGTSTGEIDLSFCRMEVTVFWSFISCYP